MSLATNIRVKTDREFGTLYRELCDCALTEMHELFFLCACLGYRHSQHNALGRNGEERFWSQTFTPEEAGCFYAMYLAERNMPIESMQDDTAVVRCMEEYASAGMRYLIEHLLCDYLVECEDGRRVDPASKDDLAKVILGFIADELCTVGEA